MYFKVQFEETRTVVCSALVKADNFESAIMKATESDVLLQEDISSKKQNVGCIKEIKELQAEPAASPNERERYDLCSFLYDSDAYRVAETVLDGPGNGSLAWLDSAIENCYDSAVEYLNRVNEGEDPLVLAQDFGFIEG